ncbi:hypothetical protein D6779_11680 [Candidatus Parcubacteria bacterium]|nr:MAG: hypothetical protein D6779_11680 [Candidatus Parcubacteria bacterium]
MNQERRVSISVRLAAKTAKGHGGQTAHDLRKAADLEYVDYQRSPRNSILIKPAPGYELREICEARRNQRQTKRSMKSNARVAFEGIITFSKLAQPIIEALPLNEQDDIFHQVAEKIAEYLNTSLHGLVVHRDESALHAHFTLAGYDMNGNPLTQTVKRQQCIQIQDVAAEVVQHLGIGRGKSKIERIKDGEPLNAYINRTVRELHYDLPNEADAVKANLQAKIEELEQKATEAEARIQKATRNLERTEQKLKEAGEENERLQKRLQTYQRRLETAQAELEETTQKLEEARSELARLQKLNEEQTCTIKENSQTIEHQKQEINRLKKAIEPFQAPVTEIKEFSRLKKPPIYKPWEDPKVVTKTKKVIQQKDHLRALAAVRQAAKEEARRRAEEAVQDELGRLHQLQNERERLAKAIEQAAEIGRLPSVEPATSAYYGEKKNPPELILYNATLLDYGERLVAAGDGTPLQQAAALYKEAHERWKSAMFWGMSEEQIEWLVKAAEKDGYRIDFAEPWAKEYAAEVRAELQAAALDRAIEDDRRPGW